MDRREGGGGPRYWMPKFEDNSYPGPTDPMYEYVRDRYSVEQWNAIDQGLRDDVLNAYYGTNLKKSGAVPVSNRTTNDALSQFLASIDQQIGKPRSGGLGMTLLGPAPTAAPTPIASLTSTPTPTSGSFADMLRGLFGGGPEGPPNRGR